MRDWTGSEACGVMSTVVPGRMVKWLESGNISSMEQLGTKKCIEWNKMMEMNDSQMPMYESNSNMVE